ncbi:MAG: hypothetical protein DRP64_04430 [Verrucomicrobia bacterium]|nr:MAG: hypothetical protein DRP64_04430 [Verrucomicrobiota bacterium]
MKTKKYTKNVQIPELVDFEDRFRRYAPFSKDTGNSLFTAVMTPESFVSAEEATYLNRPAVAGIVRGIDHLLPPAGKDRDYAKQYLGALVCCLMEANEYKKVRFNGKDQKKAVGISGFTVGQVYEKV